MKPFLLIIISLGGLLVQGCGKSCGDAARLGDFEYSQGNYPNAIKQYERALAADSGCAEGRIRARLEQLKTNPPPP